MSSNREILEKGAITSAGTLQAEGAGGFLSPEQARKFISYMVDNSAIMKDIRVETMAAPEKQLDLMLIGSRLIRKATEATEPSELAGVNIRRKELRSVKVRLSADISTDFLEDNIEGTDAKERIARELAMQFSNDIADLFINGDTAATGTDASFLTIGDGILKQAKTSSDTHKFDLTGKSDYSGVIFPGMLALMPNQFKRNKSDMRFYCSSNVSEAYIRSVATRATDLGDDALTTGRAVKYLGIQLFPVEYLPDDVIILTNKNNLVSGIQRAMKVYSQFNQKKDETEYTMYMRVDPGKILWEDALVIGYKF